MENHWYYIYFIIIALGMLPNVFTYKIVEFRPVKSNLRISLNEFVINRIGTATEPTFFLLLCKSTKWQTKNYTY